MSQAAEPEGKMWIQPAVSYEMYTQHKKYGTFSVQVLVPIESILVPLFN
jgi:hypothetical protein